MDRLPILHGQSRYAHVASLRGDTVAPQILGMSRIVGDESLRRALVYNWWSWYVRLANPKARMEAIASRPLLLAAAGKMTEHGGQTRVLLTVTHAAAHVKSLVVNMRAGLQHILATAPQLPSALRWRELVRYIVEKIIAANATQSPKTGGPPFLAMG